jgi:Domain of unknown function (DUF4124)
MVRYMLLAAALVMPTLGHAGIWHWRDASGQVHFSNVAGRTPMSAMPARGHLGALSIRPVRIKAPAPCADCQTRRAIDRRLAEINSFDDWAQCRQLANLLELYPNSWILPQWIVRDQWLEYHQQEAWLRYAEYQLDRRAENPTP